jgi:hypothetical protein
MSNLIGPSKQKQTLEVSAEVNSEPAVLRFMTPQSLVGYQRTSDEGGASISMV